MAENDIADITPDHEPIALARKMATEAIGARAGVAILISKDGSLWYRMAGLDTGSEFFVHDWSLSASRSALPAKRRVLPRCRAINLIAFKSSKQPFDVV